VAVSWKVYNVHTGKIVKAGFEDEDSAKDWLEMRRDLPTEDYLVEEMDEEEEDAVEDDDDEEIEPSFVPEELDEDENDDFGRMGFEDEDEDEDEDYDDEDEDDDEDDDY
jgi:hypothetical protein